MAVNTGRRGGCIPVGSCAFGAEGRMASIGPSSLGAKGCVAVAQGAKAVVWCLLKMKGRQYDKTHLVSWWVGRYSRRGLPLRGRGAYGPVLTHGPRVVAAEAAGAEALVGVLKIIKDASYNKTIQPPWRAMEKRHPLWWLAPPPLPKGKHVTGFSGRFAPLHPLLSPTHWILRSLPLPYESSSLVQLRFLCRPAKFGRAG